MTGLKTKQCKLKLYRPKLSTLYEVPCAVVVGIIGSSVEASMGLLFAAVWRSPSFLAALPSQPLKNRRPSRALSVQAALRNVEDLDVVAPELLHVGLHALQRHEMILAQVVEVVLQLFVPRVQDEHLEAQRGGRHGEVRD